MRRALAIIALLHAATAPAATWTVTRGDDPSSATHCAPSDCTLRGAIVAANANAGPDTIAFAIPSQPAGAPVTLTLADDLPPLVDAETTIDGFTQPGAIPGGAPTTHPSFTSTLAVTIEPRAAAPQPYVGLVLRGRGHRVQGLAFRHFHYAAIDVQGADHVIARNYIGIAASELAAYGDARYDDVPFFGIRLRRVGTAPVSGNTIGGTLADANVFGAVGTAISIVGVDGGAARNVIAGNLIGVAPDGLRMLTLLRGIELRDSHRIVVGTAHDAPAQAGNIVAGIGPPGTIAIEIDGGTQLAVAGNALGGTLLPVVLPHRIRHGIAIGDAPIASEIAGNVLLGEADAVAVPATAAVTFERALSVAVDTDFVQERIVVRRLGTPDGAIAVDVSEPGGAASQWFDTDPPALAAGAPVRLAWGDGDASPRVLVATYRGPPGAGPYGGLPGPPAYGAELRLALSNPDGTALGPHPGFRFALHHDTTARAAEYFDRVFELGGFE